MQAKNVLYAAVGAPIVAARKVSDQVSTWKAKVDEETAGYTEAAEKALNSWAAEGEKVVSRISKGAVVEEISQKVDLDQAKEQVSKLRDQLEDMLDTWRHSFRPEDEQRTTGTVTEAETPGEKPTTEKAGASKTSGTTKKTTTASKSATKKTGASKTSGTTKKTTTGSKSATKKAGASATTGKSSKSTTATKAS